MKKRIYLSWYCAECEKTGIAEVELPTRIWDIKEALKDQHGLACKNLSIFVEIRNVEVAVK